MPTLAAAPLAARTVSPRNRALASTTDTTQARPATPPTRNPSQGSTDSFSARSDRKATPVKAPALPKGDVDTTALYAAQPDESSKQGVDLEQVKRLIADDVNEHGTMTTPWSPFLLAEDNQDYSDMMAVVQNQYDGFVWRADRKAGVEYTNSYGLDAEELKAFLDGAPPKHAEKLAQRWRPNDPEDTRTVGDILTQARTEMLARYHEFDKP